MSCGRSTIQVHGSSSDQEGGCPVRISIKGRNTPVTDDLREHVAKRFGKIEKIALALMLLQMDRSAEAVALLRKRIGTGGDYLSLWFLGEALNRAGMAAGSSEEGESVAVLTRSIAANPNVAQTQILLAKLLARRGELDAAEKHLSRALQLEPENVSATYQLAQVYQKKGDSARARQLFAKVSKGQGRGPRAVHARRPAAYHPRRFEVKRCVWVFAGILAGGAALAQLPRNQEARALDAKGTALAEAGKIAEAVEQFRKALLLAPDLPEARYHLGLAHDRLGQTDEAMAEFEEALRLQGDFLQARYLLAGCCRKRGDYEGEMRLLAGIVQTEPAFTEARYNYGLALQRSEKSAEAVEQLRAAVRAGPRNFRYLLALGIALADRDPGEAVTLLRRAVELSPDEAEARYNLALALAVGGDNAAAVGEFRTAIRLNPGHAGARRGLGVALMRADGLAESAAELRRACDAAPFDAEAANNLGLVLLRLKDIAGAVAALRARGAHQSQADQSSFQPGASVPACRARRRCTLRDRSREPAYG